MTNNNNELLNNELLNNEDRGGHEQSLYPRNTNEPHGLHTLLNTTRRWLEPTPSSPMCKTRIAQRTTTVRHCCYSPYQTPVHRQLPIFTTTTTNHRQPLPKTSTTNDDKMYRITPNRCCTTCQRGEGPSIDPQHHSLVAIRAYPDGNQLYSLYLLYETNSLYQTNTELRLRPNVYTITAA